MSPALAGLVVGLAYAAISVYWAVGGRWLLNTVGISLSQPGQAGHLVALLAVWGAAAVKAVAAVLPLLAIGVWPRTANGALRRLARVLTWIEAAILVGYGGPDRERAAGPGRRDRGGRPCRPPGPEMARIPLGPLVPDLGHLRLPGALAVAAG